MVPQVKGDSRKHHEEQASSSLEEKHSPQHQRNWRHLGVSNVCSILMAIGLVLIVSGKFWGENTLVGFIITNSGLVAFLIGLAMFAAIVRTTLDV